MTNILANNFVAMPAGGFNKDWDEEADMILVEYALLERLDTCFWLNHHNAPCGVLVKGKDFSSHLRDWHGVVGPSSSQHMCRWYGCREGPLNRDSLIRHMKEQHLHWRWPCPRCQNTFTRKTTMLEHRSRCHMPWGR